MKKNILLTFTKVLYILFAIGTIIIFWMLYSGIDNSFAFKLAIGYLLLTFFLILYVPIITILNSRKLKWYDVRKKIIKFIVWFILLATLNYIFDRIFRHSNIDLLRNLSVAFGVAFGISFIDITLLKDKVR